MCRGNTMRHNKRRGLDTCLQESRGHPPDCAAPKKYIANSTRLPLPQAHDCMQNPVKRRRLCAATLLCQLPQPL